jgi:Na+-exporting ATPase
MLGFGNGNFGHGCNRSYSAECDLVFRARATTCLTCFALFLAWEMVDMPQIIFPYAAGIHEKYFTSGFVMSGVETFLFWAIIAAFITIFPTQCIPVISHDVFKHTWISWEWVVVFVEASIFSLL